MLSGLGSLLFGGGEGRGQMDNATVDQTPAGQTVPLDTQDMENGWVLVDKAENEEKAEDQAEDQEQVQPQQEPAIGEEETEQGGNELENQPAQHGAVQQRPRNVPRPARALRATTLELQQVKVMYTVQRRQQQAKTKALNKRCLEASNKVRCMRKPASAHCRILRPSCQMNGRKSQRQY